MKSALRFRLAVASACLVGSATIPACSSEDDGSEEGVVVDEESSELGPDQFSDISPYCPATSSWPAWGQTPLSTWDRDVEPVVSHVIGETGLHSSTYVGHDPTIGRAADWRPHSREEGTRFANWLLANAHLDHGPLGIQYIVWQGQIFNIARAAEGVRKLPNRGSFTQNHCDHVHTTFVPAGTVRYEPNAATAWGTAEAVGSDGCTAEERANAAKFGCGCVDHKGAGGFCPGTGCTAKETADCEAKRMKCSLHRCQ